MYLKEGGVLLSPAALSPGQQLLSSQCQGQARSVQHGQISHSSLIKLQGCWLGPQA